MENKLVVSPDMEPSLWARYLNAYIALIKEGGLLSRIGSKSCSTPQEI
jgi:hypothetical protein